MRLYMTLCTPPSLLCVCVSSLQHTSLTLNLFQKLITFFVLNSSIRPLISTVPSKFRTGDQLTDGTAGSPFGCVSDEIVVNVDWQTIHTGNNEIEVAVMSLKTLKGYPCSLWDVY